METEEAEPNNVNRYEHSPDASSRRPVLTSALSLTLTYISYESDVLIGPQKAPTARPAALLALWVDRHHQ